jgi:hypothetical protein
MYLEVNFDFCFPSSALDLDGITKWNSTEHPELMKAHYICSLNLVHKIFSH